MPGSLARRVLSQLGEDIPRGLSLREIRSIAQECYLGDEKFFIVWTRRRTQKVGRPVRISYGWELRHLYSGQTGWLLVRAYILSRAQLEGLDMTVPSFKQLLGRRD